jgi:hypothetical protein
MEQAIESGLFGDRGQSEHPLLNQLRNPNQRLEQRVVDVEFAFILREVSLSVRLIENPPLFRRYSESVFQTLKDHVSALGAVTMPTKCRKRERVSRVVCEIESAIAAEDCDGSVFQPCGARTKQAVHFCSRGRLGLELPNTREASELT